MSALKSILHQFPPPPQHGHMTALEKDGQMMDFPDTLPAPSLIDYPEIVLSKESINRTNLRYEKAQLAFLSTGQASWKRFINTGFSEGLFKMMEEITEANDEVPPWISSTCKVIVSLVEAAKTLSMSFFAQSFITDEEIFLKYMHVNNWLKSPIQSIAWHPHVAKAAVALRDDSVHIYYSGNSLSPILKHKLQKQVADLAWQPLSASVLAVACKTCVLVWHVEPTSLAVRPSASTAQVLHCTSQSPVTSLAWSPDGSLLISASPKHNSIIIWDVPKENGVVQKQSTGRGVSFLSYSPDGTKLFTATPSKMFRVWSTKHWQWENWSNLIGPCTASSWSPDGSVLVFAMEGDSALYAVRFPVGGDGDGVSAVSLSVLLADVSPVNYSMHDGSIVRAGGQVKSIVWDGTGERLAVMFETNETGSDQFVAVFKTTIHPLMELLPGGFVKGKSGESAVHIAFMPNCSKGALLSVVWSSGRVGYVPMFFIPAQKIHHRSSANFDPLSPGPFLFQR
ncbi:aladin [Biomphalaria glabrata]|nr:aladin-like [Biomphalaria glabrata]